MKLSTLFALTPLLALTTSTAVPAPVPIPAGEVSTETFNCHPTGPLVPLTSLYTLISTFCSSSRAPIANANSHSAILRASNGVNVKFEYMEFDYMYSVKSWTVDRRKCEGLMRRAVDRCVSNGKSRGANFWGQGERWVWAVVDAL